MLLLALHVDRELAGRVGAATVAADPLRGFLTAYWQVEGGIGEDPATAALFAALPAGGGVALLPTERYREVVAVKRPESEGTARAGRPEPSGL